MNLRTRVVIIGGIAGGLLGVCAAYLFLRSIPVSADREGRARLPSIQPAKALSVGLGVLTVLKQVTGLGRT